MMFFNVLMSVSLIISVTSTPLWHTKPSDYKKYPESDPRRWLTLAQSEINQHIKHHMPSFKPAKNAIIFLGDGMGPSTVTAGRIYKGQLKGMSGEEENLEFDLFPHSALLKTYNVDRQVADSAGTATAYQTGVKANFGTIGVDSRVNREENDCKLIQDAAVSSIMTWAQKAGKSTGIVTTTRVTHASPAAAYAHTQERDFEGSIPETCAGKPLLNRHLCKDIAAQLIESEVGRNFNVILGGGRSFMTPPQVLDPQTNDPGTRTDGRNLINNWIAGQLERENIYAYVNDTQGLLSIDTNNVDHLMGLFAPKSMAFEDLRDRTSKGQPSLVEMTRVAIEIAQKNKRGFVLFIEGGQIDTAHHQNQAKLALSETVQFDSAIRQALEMTGEDTSIVVTADHSHAFTINGYPARGNPILGFAAPDDNGSPYTTLMYGTGPGYRASPEELAKIKDQDINDPMFRQAATVPIMKQATHGGEDVAAYARGPFSWLFAGTHEQTFVPLALAYALCIHEFEKAPHCILKNVHDKLPWNKHKIALTAENQNEDNPTSEDSEKIQKAVNAENEVLQKHLENIESTEEKIEKAVQSAESSMQPTQETVTSLVLKPSSVQV